MKILLIQPPPRKIMNEDIVVPSLGIAYLAAVAEKKGYDVSIIDAFAEGLDIKLLEDRIKTVVPDLIGITVMTPVRDNAFKTAKICRKYTKYIVIGGPHVSVVGKKIFEQCPDLDYAIQGEGEVSFLSLLDKIDGNKDIKNVPGLITRDFENSPAAFLDNLDSLPFPARHLLPNEKYRYILSKGRITTMFTSRGCPYHCIFCDKAVFGSKWRGRSASNVLDEIEYVVKDFRIKSIIFYDDLFTLKKERIKEICQGILERGLKVEWKCESRVNIVDQDILKWMKKAGCSMIAYGVESGNQKGLDYLNKGIDIEQIRRAFKLTREAGIKPMAYFILGIPVETYEDELRTIKFAKEIKPAFAQFSVLSPTPGTKLFNEAVKKGWYREVNAMNPLDKDIKRPAIINENWNEYNLNKILKEAHRKFYINPAYVFERLKEIRNPKEFLKKAMAGVRLLRWYISKGNG